MLWLTAGVFCFTLMNLWLWPRLTAGWAGPWPRVSVLVPARNEAANIGPCIASLTNQRYPDYEVILLDDQSTDGTAAVVRGTSNRVQILEGKPLPAGWLGKSWACAQLAEAATGEWLLFVDADTVHQPDMLQRTIATAIQRRAGLLSGIPGQISESIEALLLVSLQFLLTAAFLPVALIPLRNHSSIVAASGAYLLFHRTLYQRIGGHAAIRASMVDDLALARRAKEFGGRVVLADITPVVACRMYRSGVEAWNGFSKNAYPAMGRSPFVLVLAIASMGVLFIAPAVWMNAPAWLLATSTGALIYNRFGLPPWMALLLPAQAAAFIGIAVRSAWRTWSGKGYTWKGRVYQ